MSRRATPVRTTPTCGVLGCEQPAVQSTMYLAPFHFCEEHKMTRAEMLRARRDTELFEWVDQVLP